jgi:hypothetical protein
MIGYTYTAVRSVARETVELLRSEVVTLVHAHAEDAVKRHVARMLPPGAPESPTTPASGEGVAIGGAWGAVLATVSRVPMAATVCAVTGFLTFSVYVLAKGLKII